MAEMPNKFKEANPDDELEPGAVNLSAEEETQKPKQPSALEGAMDAIRDVPHGGLQLTPEAQKTKEILAKQPKVGFIIPLDPGEKPGAMRTVTINGYRFEIKKNKYVMLPRAVAELLASSMQTEIDALHNNPMNLAMADAEKKKALGL